MKIATRLTLGFGIVLALLATGFLTGLNALRQFNAQTEIITQREAVKIDHLNNANELAYMNALLALKATLLTEQAEQVRAFDEIAQNREKFLKYIEQTEPLLVTEKGHQLMAEMREALTAYGNSRTQVKTLLLAGKHDEAVHQAVTDMLPKLTAFTKPLQGLLDAADATMAKASVESEALYRSRPSARTSKPVPTKTKVDPTHGRNGKATGATIVLDDEEHRAGAFPDCSATDHRDALAQRVYPGHGQAGR